MGPADGERGSRAAIAGFVFSGLFVVGWLLLYQAPNIDASGEELVAYYSSPSERRASLIAGLYVAPFGAIAFIWFAAALRDRLVRAAGRENVLLSTVQLITGALFVTSLFLVGAVQLALVWFAEHADAVDVDAVRAVLALGTVMAQVVGLRAGAVFVAVSATRALRCGLFPRWFAYASFAAALVLLFAASAWRPLTLLLPLWVATASAVVLSERANTEVEAGA